MTGSKNSSGGNSTPATIERDQNNNITANPFFIMPRYISPAPGIKAKQKVKKLFFFMV